VLPRSARPKTLDQIVDYVRGLSEPERQQYFTKDGMREYSGLLELNRTVCRPHGMARFLFWDLVSREVKESGDRDALQFITAELQDRVCYQAAMAEIWLQSVEQQLAPPSPEQWARFREMQPQAQQLALNVLTDAQVRRLNGQLADRYTVAEDDVVRLFQENLRELLVPHPESAIS
jgi:hypothetical protein